MWSRVQEWSDLPLVPIYCVSWPLAPQCWQVDLYTILALLQSCSGSVLQGWLLPAIWHEPGPLKSWGLFRPLVMELPPISMTLVLPPSAQDPILFRDFCTAFLRPLFGVAITFKMLTVIPSKNHVLACFPNLLALADLIWFLSLYLCLWPFSISDSISLICFKGGLWPLTCISGHSLIS